MKSLILHFDELLKYFLKIAHVRWTGSLKIKLAKLICLIGSVYMDLQACSVCVLSWSVLNLLIFGLPEPFGGSGKCGPESSGFQGFAAEH